MAAKICIIGAGSGAFSLSLIRDICLTPNLEGSRVTFMDIAPDRLDAAYELCRRYAEELGFHLDLEKTLDRRTALAGADFVVNTALAAPHERLRAGWEIAQRLGYNWGASFHIMYDEAFWVNFYQLRLFESVIRDALEICPQAWHLQVANPVLAGITYLTRKYPRAKIVGLCHGFGEIYYIAENLGLSREGLTFEIPGVNHFVWCTRLYHQGKDVFPILDRWIEEVAPTRNGDGKRQHSLSPKIIDLYKRFGALPVGDTAHWSGAAWPLWYHSDAETEQRWNEAPWEGWDHYFTHVARNAEEMKRMADDTSLRLTDHLPHELSGEPMVPIIESIACDIPRVVIGNVQNSGDFVPGIPRDFEVEIATLVSKRGIEGIQSQGLPPALIQHILRDRVAPVNLELEAYERGSRELLLQLIMMDPWTRSERQAQQLLEEVLALPYHEEMRQHYRE
ncbi:MAG: family 4 glycosyl hydrolase [Anaerolineae bacterium]